MEGCGTEQRRSADKANRVMRRSLRSLKSYGYIRTRGVPFLTSFFSPTLELCTATPNFFFEPASSSSVVVARCPPIMSLPSRTVTFGRSQPQHQNLYLHQQQQYQQLQQQQQQQQSQAPVVPAPQPVPPQLSLPTGPNIALPGPSSLSLPGANGFRAPTPAQPIVAQPTPPKPITNAVAGPSSPASSTPTAAAATPAALTLEQQTITAVEGIVPTLQNIVATVNLDCRLDLKTIALHARNAEYNPKVSTSIY